MLIVTWLILPASDYDRRGIVAFIYDMVCIAKVTQSPLNRGNLAKIGTATYDMALT